MPRLGESGVLRASDEVWSKNRGICSESNTKRMSTAVSVLVGTSLSLIVAYKLPQYFDFVPDFDIWVILLIVGLNLLQCLPNPHTPASTSQT